MRVGLLHPFEKPRKDGLDRAHAMHVLGLVNADPPFAGDVAEADDLDGILGARAGDPFTFIMLAERAEPMLGAPIALNNTNPPRA